MSLMPLFRRCAFAALSLLLVSATPADTAPKVAVSVLPVHSLVAAVMRDVGEPRLLLPAGQSPHGAQLKPSQVKRLGEADLIVWLGPSFERSLDKTIDAQHGRARVVTLLERDEIHRLPIRHGGVWEAHQHDDEHHEDEHDEDAHGHDDEHEEAHGHEHEHDEHKHDEHDEHDERAEHDDHDSPASSIDPHIWLSVANANAIARIVARELSVLDPANRARYAANLNALQSQLQQLRQALRARLHAVGDTPFVVFHDAYHYFEQEFNLRPAGAVTLNPERPPGAKRISEIKHAIESRQVRCVFREPQFAPRLVHALVADTAAAVGVLDPLGASLQPGPDAWFRLLHNLADSLAGCLE